jgi:hypothetical protein
LALQLESIECKVDGTTGDLEKVQEKSRFGYDIYKSCARGACANCKATEVRHREDSIATIRLTLTLLHVFLHWILHLSLIGVGGDANGFPKWISRTLMAMMLEYGCTNACLYWSVSNPSSIQSFSGINSHV